MVTETQGGSASAPSKKSSRVSDVNMLNREVPLDYLNIDKIKTKNQFELLGEKLMIQLSRPLVVSADTKGIDNHYSMEVLDSTKIFHNSVENSKEKNQEFFGHNSGCCDEDLLSQSSVTNTAYDWLDLEQRILVEIEPGSQKMDTCKGSPASKSQTIIKSKIGSSGYMRVIYQPFQSYNFALEDGFELEVYVPIRMMSNIIDNPALVDVSCLSHLRYDFKADFASILMHEKNLWANEFFQSEDWVCGHFKVSADQNRDDNGNLELKKANKATSNFFLDLLKCKVVKNLPARIKTVPRRSIRNETHGAKILGFKMFFSSMSLHPFQNLSDVMNPGKSFFAVMNNNIYNNAVKLKGNKLPTNNGGMSRRRKRFSRATEVSSEDLDKSISYRVLDKWDVCLILLASNGNSKLREFYIRRNLEVNDTLRFSLKMYLEGVSKADENFIVICNEIEWDEIQWMPDSSVWIRNTHLQVSGFRWVY